MLATIPVAGKKPVAQIPAIIYFSNIYVKKILFSIKKKFK